MTCAKTRYNNTTEVGAQCVLLAACLGRDSLPPSPWSLMRGGEMNTLFSGCRPLTFVFIISPYLTIDFLRQLVSFSAVDLSEIIFKFFGRSDSPCSGSY